MANNNHVRAISFSVTIETPMHKPLVLFKTRDKHQLEEIFITLRDNEQNLDYKKNYDRCHAILKYAHSCWGTLKDVSNNFNTVSLTFAFDSIEGLTAFEKGLQKAVERVTM